MSLELIGTKADATEANEAEPSDYRSAQNAAAVQHRHVIAPTSGWQGINLPELWRYRDLLLLLALRDVKVRYKQTVLGPIWIILQPIITTALYTLIFDRLANIDSGLLPYPVFCFSGVLFWGHFSRTISSGTTALVTNAGLIQKVYFPRLVFPLSPILANSVDFGVGFVVLAVLMIKYQVAFTPALAVLIPAIVLATVAGLGIGLMLGSLNVHYRDVGQMSAMLLQLWMYATPIVFPMSVVEKRAPAIADLMLLNPATGVVGLVRWGLSPSEAFPVTAVAYSVVISMALFVAGLMVFRRMERVFADII